MSPGLLKEPCLPAPSNEVHSASRRVKAFTRRRRFESIRGLGGALKSGLRASGLGVPRVELKGFWNPGLKLELHCTARPGPDSLLGSDLPMLNDIARPESQY